MRILEIAPPWFTVPPTGYGGIEQVVAQLTDGLVDAGHEVTLLASGGSTSKATVQTVFDVPPSAALGSTCHELIHVVAGYHRRDAFDVIHDHSGFTGAAFGALLDGPPVVHTLHGPWVEEVATFHRSIGDALHRVAISEDQRSRAPTGVQVEHMVHNGISLTEHPLRAEADPDRHLAFVGRVNAEKGPEVAVRVARILGRHLKMAVKINEPAEQVYWDEHVAPLLDGADVEVVRNGTKQDAIDIMSGAEATLFPIAWPEPFGLVMVESMAVGTPVIAYAMGASMEVIDSGRTGVLVPPDDLDAFVAAVQTAGSLARAACRAHVVERFSSAAMVAGYEAVFAAVTEQQRSPRTIDRTPKLLRRPPIEWGRRQDDRRPVAIGGLSHRTADVHDATPA
ncbi:MAG: glycosyltransferase family 4 protein [Nitriliruptoraceae bacterium]